MGFKGSIACGVQGFAFNGSMVIFLDVLKINDVIQVKYWSLLLNSRCLRQYSKTLLFKHFELTD